MDAITIAIIMMAAVVLSSWIARIIPFPLPLPLIQIVFGYGITAYGHWGVDLNPHLFMFLFLPPLLFLDGWRIPKDALTKDIGTITQLAFGLVFFTVLGVGWFVHWLIPSMPLPVAFALAAVISPTDPVAVSAIARKVPFPPRMMHILEGEALFNDASGLVCLNFAVVATLTGAFSLADAAFDFAKMVIGGLIVGVAISGGMIYLKKQVSRYWGEDSGTQILVSILIPFVSYMFAEHFHFSGVLAAVSAGITMSYCGLYNRVMAVTRIRRDAVWDSLQMLANGAMFVLLGEQLPSIVDNMKRTVLQTGETAPYMLLIYVLVISVLLAVMRWLWVWISLKAITLFYRLRGLKIAALNPRLIAAMSLSGVRGSITLAGVMSLPFMMGDGATPFPARDLAIFLATGVILFTLITASVTLPPILKGLDAHEDIDIKGNEHEDRVIVAMAEAAMRAIDKEQHAMAENSPEPDLYLAAANRVMNFYRARADLHHYTSAEGCNTTAETIRKTEYIERKIRLAALNAERDEIYSQRRSRNIDEHTMNKLSNGLDLEEARLTQIPH